MTVEKTAVTTVAGLMALAARTAPKAKGQDEILITLLTSTQQKKLSLAMTKYGTKNELVFSCGMQKISLRAMLFLLSVSREKSLSGLIAEHAGMPHVRHLQKHQAP